MLTRKQMWRRVGGRGRVSFGDAPPPSAEPKAAPEAPPASGDNAEERRGRKVTFNYVVRVVLVPCTKELHPLNAQLWWDADDYADFRREYVLAMRAAAAAAASQQRDEEQQQPLPSRAKGPSASAGLDAASPGLDADEPTKPEIVVEPPPTAPPSPVSASSLATPLPPTKPPPAAATPGTLTAAAATVGPSGGHQQQEAPNGRVLSTAETVSSEPMAQELARPPRSKGPVSFSPSRSRVIKMTKKWTPSAGMMAAKAAVEAEEEGYRTESMSSASGSTLSSGDSSDPDSDDEAHQEHLVPVFGREQLRQPAAASRRLPRRPISA